MEENGSTSENVCILEVTYSIDTVRNSTGVGATPSRVGGVFVSNTKMTDLLENTGKLGPHVPTALWTIYTCHRGITEINWER